MKLKYDSPVITVEELTKADVLLASGGSGSGDAPTHGSTIKDNAGISESTWGTLESFV